MLHLNDYLKAEEIFFAETGHTVIHELHSIAYAIVNETDMRRVRDALKPHRGEVYE